MANRFPLLAARLQALGELPEMVRRRMREAQTKRHVDAVRQCNRWAAERRAEQRRLAAFERERSAAAAIPTINPTTFAIPDPRLRVGRPDPNLPKIPRA